MDAKTRLKRNKLAQEHFDARADIFEVNDFDRETIAVESWKLGFDAGIEHERAKLKAAQEVVCELWMIALSRGGGFEQDSRECDLWRRLNGILEKADESEGK